MIEEKTSTPFHIKICPVISEVYAYLLAEHGPHDPRIQMPLDELRKRDSKLERLEDEASSLCGELEQLKDDSVS